MNIFKKASQLRKQHPRKYSDYQDYVAWARREIHHKGSHRTAKKKPAKKKAVGRLVKAHGIVHAKEIGSLPIGQLRSRYKKQLQEKLAWELLARDQAKNKTERKKKSKQVVSTRRELNNLK